MAKFTCCPHFVYSDKMIHVSVSRIHIQEVEAHPFQQWYKQPAHNHTLQPLVMEVLVYYVIGHKNLFTDH